MKTQLKSFLSQSLIEMNDSNEGWLETYVREYCHFIQQKLNVPVWKEYSYYSEDMYKLICQWYNGEDISEELLSFYIKLCRDVEEDCSKIVIQTIKKYRLPIKQRRYIQKTNSYLYFLSTVPFSRCLIPNNKLPNSIPQIVEQMPTTFQKNYDDFPDNFIDLLRQYCYEIGE